MHPPLTKGQTTVTTEHNTYYKVLSPKGESIHRGNLKWSLPTQKKDGSWEPGKWHKVEGDIIVCSNGLHLTTSPYRWYDKDCACYAAEGAGENDRREDKTAFRRARLLYLVPHPQWWLDAMAFIASIPNTPFMKPDGNPLPEWKLFTAPTLKEAWAAARNVARNVARNAAGDAAWAAAGAAAWAAAGAAAGDAAWAAAWDVAGDAAWAAARNVARNAAGDAAGDAARNAAWDAALYTKVINICADLKLDEKHIEHAKARWQVWQKGYCLLCDVDGVLYVCAAEPVKGI